MRKLLGGLLLIVCLSSPTFAGHTQIGGVACSCGTPGCIEDYVGECGNRALSSSTETPIDGAAELGIALVAILLWLRLKA